MSDKVGIQKYFENMLADLVQEVRGGINADVRSKDTFFNSIMNDLSLLASSLPYEVASLQGVIENLGETVEEHRKEASARNDEYSQTPIGGKVRAYGDMDISEMGMDNVMASIDTIRKEMAKHVKYKELDKNGRENGYMQSLYDELNQKLSGIKKIIMENDNLYSYQKEELINIIDKILGEMDGLLIESTNKQMALQESVEAICKEYQEKALERAKIEQDEIEEKEEQEPPTEELSEEKEEQEPQTEELPEEKELTPEQRFAKEREDVRNRFIQGKLRSINIQGKEFYVIKEPQIDPSTNEFINRGVICSAAAFDDVYIKGDNLDDILHSTGNKTETFMTLDEAKEMGLYNSRPKKTKARDDRDYDDDPFSAG